MYETGPGLLPGALPIIDAKGHPLFFFFVSSLWMRIVGTSVFAVHVLPFLISLGTLVTTFIVVKKHANILAANLSVILLSVQSLFLAQATFLLPEMLVALLLLLSIHFFLSRRFWLFAIASSMMVLTKETSIVFAGGFIVYYFFNIWNSKSTATKLTWNCLLLFIPILIYGGFLVLHKLEFGSYFFKEHVNFIDVSNQEFFRKLQSATGMIFTRYGRNIILIAFVFSVVRLIIKKVKIKYGAFIGLLLLQTILFLLFSSLNFYTPRYMLGLLVLFIVMASIVFSQSKFNIKIINWVLISTIIAFPLYFSLTKKSNCDHNLGYVEVVKTHQEMVQFCEEQNWQDKSISASFNMISCLRNPHLGYLSSVKSFSNVKDLERFREAEIILLESTIIGNNDIRNTIRNENVLLKKVNLDHAWGQIYVKEKELK